MTSIVTRRMLLAVVLLTWIAPALHAQNPSTESIILTLEAKRSTAMEKHDIPTLTSLFSDSLTYAHSSGAIDSKTSLLGLLKSGDLQYKSIKESDVKVRLYGTVAVLTGRALIVAKRVNQDEASHDLSFTGVWARENGQWKFIAWQSTSLPAAK